MKLLMLDIETAPNLATVWGLWNQNIALNQLIKAGYTLCWAAKWHGEKEIMFDSIVTGERRMIRRVHSLLNQADAVCHYNGTKFDIPTLNKEFLLHGLQPPAPYKQIDLLRTARRQFRLPSNKLDYVAKVLKLGKKTQHKGHELWLECMAKEREAWRTMERYNKQDVILLEKVYEHLKGWIVGHPNLTVHRGDECCPTCASTNYNARGYETLRSGRYRRFHCNDCGKWFRAVAREKHSGASFQEAR